MRTIIALAAIAATITLAMQPGTSDAAGARRAGGAKMCIATNSATGKRMSWRCSASEKCCFDTLFNTGSCVPASGICL